MFPWENNQLLLNVRKYICNPVKHIIEQLWLKSCNVVAYLLLYYLSGSVLFAFRLIPPRRVVSFRR